MRNRGMPLANEYVYYAGVAIAMSAPIVGLAFGMFLERKRWASWSVVIGGLLAGGTMAAVGIFVFAAAFSTA